MKKAVVIICVICVVVILCVWLSPIRVYMTADKGSLKLKVYRVFLIAHENNVKLKGYLDLSSSHFQDSYHSLFYKNKLICSDVSGYDPKRFLLSPDSDLILYLLLSPEGEKYGIYSIKEDKIIESSGELYLVGLNQKVEWLGDKVVLSDDEQKDILDLKTGAVEIVKLKDAVKNSGYDDNLQP